MISLMRDPSSEVPQRFFNGGISYLMIAKTTSIWHDFGGLFRSKARQISVVVIRDGATADARSIEQGNDSDPELPR